MNYRMLDAPEYGWLVPMPASEDPALDSVRIELLDVMHNLSEDYDCSSFSCYLPWMAWDIITQTVEQDGGRHWLWTREGPDNDERAAIMALAERAGGWWIEATYVQGAQHTCPCDDCKVEPQWSHVGLLFVPMVVWCDAFAAYKSAGEQGIKAGERVIRERMP